MADPSDEDLLARVAVGDGDAFETFMERHLSAIGGYARRMLGPTAADDVTQECFLRIWRAAAVPVPPPVPASVPVLVPLRPSPAVRWAAVLGTPPWAALAAGLVAFVLGALVGASDGALVSVADPPDAATWIEASISAAAGDIEWEVLR